MQDGAPSHKPKASMTFLHTHNVAVLKWPGNSPDMNPIETLWGIIKNRLRGQTLRTKQEMIAALIKAWHRDDSVITTCQRLIDSMPSRIAALIAAKGGHTQY